MSICISGTGLQIRIKSVEEDNLRMKILACCRQFALNIFYEVKLDLLKLLPETILKDEEFKLYDELEGEWIMDEVAITSVNIKRLYNLVITKDGHDPSHKETNKTLFLRFSRIGN